MTQKFSGHPLSGFLPSPLTRLRPISGVSRKTLCAGITPAAAKPAPLRVLRNSPWAMPLSGYELVLPEITCDKSALLCFH